MSGWASGGSTPENRTGVYQVGTLDLSALFGVWARDIYSELTAPDPLFEFQVLVTSAAAPGVNFSMTFTPVPDVFNPRVIGTVFADAPFDFEALPSLALQFDLNTSTVAQAGDPPEFFPAAAATRTLAVTNVAEAPTGLQLSAATVAENAAGNTVVGTFTAQIPDANPGAFTYTLVSGQGFQIVGSQLRVASGATLDYETTPQRDVVVDVRSGTGPTARFTLTVDLQDVAEAPSGLTLSASAIAERAEAGTLVAELAGIDPDGGELTYTLVSGPGFEVSGNQLLVSGTPMLDFETARSVSVQIRVTDEGGLSRVFTRSISVTDVQENPTDLVLDGPALPETALPGTLVALLSATDPLGGEVSFSVPAGRGFYVDGNGLYLDNGANLDFEGRPVITLPITATTSTGHRTTFQQNIALEDVQENPANLVVDGGSVVENAEGGTLVAILTAEDPLGGEVSFTVPANSGFYVDAGGLFVANGARLDHEAASSITLNITATSSAGHRTVFQRSIAIEDVEEHPRNFVLDGGVIAENALAGTVIGSLGAEDPLGGDIVFSVAPNSGFVVDGNMLLLGPGRSLDFEGASSIPVSITARTVVGGYTTVFQREITVEDVPEAPTGLSLVGSSVIEDAAPGTLVATLSATDPDSTAFTFGLLAGDGFAINGNRLVIAGNSFLDFETRPSVEVLIAVADAEGNVTEFTRTITIRDAAEAPTGVTVTGASVAENAAVGTVVGTLAGTDPQGGPFTYSTPEGSRFVVSGNNLVVAQGAALDFETRPVETVTITVADAQGHSATFTRSITVTDANDAPTVQPWLGNNLVRIAESAPAGREVARFSVADVDPGDRFSLSLIGPDAGKFVLDGERLRLAEGVRLDAEEQASLLVGVRATDAGNLSDSAFFSVRVIDEAASVQSLSAMIGQAGVFTGLTIERTSDGPRLYSGSVEIMAPENGLLRLLDGTLSFGTDTPLAALERLYHGALGRPSDGDGRMNYMQHLDNGMSLAEIGLAMLNSPEFNGWVAQRTGGQLPGQLTNAEFVEILYQRVLGRPSDAEGHAFWTYGLDIGAHTREDLLVSFTQSPEARVLFAEETEVLWALNREANLIRSFYDVTFDRDPDIEGQTFWMQSLQNGLSVQQMAQFFVNSDEFQAIITSRSTVQAVTELYRQGLEREPDAEGLAFWASHIDDGTGHWAQILAGFVTSPEQYEQMRAYRDGGELFGLT
jgi:hypothetical protein